MKNTRNLLLTTVLTALLAIAPLCHGEEYSNSPGDKAARAATNFFTAPLEIPKNMINTVNDSNLVLGTIGGLLKGILHAAARMGAGVTELLTIPLATKPIAQPVRVWDDYDIDTTYGPYFRLDDSAGSEMAMTDDQEVTTLSANDQSALQAALAAADAANRRAEAAEQAAARAARLAAETSQKLDQMFEKSMMK